MRLSKGHLAAVVLLLFSSVSSYASPFMNGGFELHHDITDDLDSKELVLPTGDHRLDGWDIISGSINYVKSPSRWQAAEGQFSIDLNGEHNDAYAIAQTFDTVAGMQYQVSFAMAGNPDGGPVVKELHASAAGSFAKFAFDSTGSTRQSMRWSDEHFMFTASDSSTTLRFTSLTPGDYGPTLDNVRVTAVPEPGMLGLVGAGLAVLALIKRRRP